MKSGLMRYGALAVLALAFMAWTPRAAAHPPAAGSPRTVLARGFGQPDDLAWGPRGAIYFSDFGNGAVNVLLPNGTRRVVKAGLSGPEGIVVLPGGDLAVVEQNRNRILRVNPRTGATHVLAAIPNPTMRSGIDGIALDPHDGSLLIPDSPSGRVLRLDPAGHVRVLATGLGRPVGVLALSGGRLVVVDETLNGVFLIGRNGVIHRLGGYLSVPDDVVSDGHGGYEVTCLGDNTVRHLARDGTITLVASRLRNPQGLLRRANGALIVAEEDANQITLLRV